MIATQNAEATKDATTLDATIPEAAATNSRSSISSRIRRRTKERRNEGTKEQLNTPQRHNWYVNPTVRCDSGNTTLQLYEFLFKFHQ
jgi:hypothetical protein